AVKAPDRSVVGVRDGRRAVRRAAGGWRGLVGAPAALRAWSGLWSHLVHGAAEGVHVLGRQTLGVLQVHARLLVAERPHDEHGARAAVDDRGGDAAAEDAGEARASVAGHDDDGHVRLAGALDDDVARVADADLRLGGEAHRTEP